MASAAESSTSERRARCPVSVPDCVWGFPDPEATDGSGADEHGLVALGADLEPSTLVHAYRQGMFPWPHGGRRRMPWFSPNPRGLLPPEKLRVSKSLRQRLRRSGWETTVDADFEQVISACANPHQDDGTWITPRMRTAYTELHDLGWAHSVEVWDGGRLVGGLYGVQVGAIFTGESMFHHDTDASKVALVELVYRMAEAGGQLIDVQLPTPHLASLGAIAVPRSLFLELLRELRDDPVRMVTDRLPVARHA